MALTSQQQNLLNSINSMSSYGYNYMVPNYVADRFGQNVYGPKAVESVSILGKPTASSVPVYDVTAGTTYFPSNGQWIQTTSSSLPGYVPASKATMSLPTISNSSRPIVGPDGTTYFPLQAINEIGRAHV